jgi:hypothetical protein
MKRAPVHVEHAHGDGARRAMAQRMIHALLQQWRRGLLQDGGKTKGARVWELTE